MIVGGAGLLWQACRQVYRVGMRTHLVDVYNATDFFMLKFYTASLVLRRLADLKAPNIGYRVFQEKTHTFYSTTTLQLSVIDLRRFRQNV